MGGGTTGELGWLGIVVTAIGVESSKPKAIHENLQRNAMKTHYQVNRLQGSGRRLREQCHWPDLEIVIIDDFIMKM